MRRQIPLERSEDVTAIASTFSDRVYAVRSATCNQSNRLRPDIELHRIAFARRKTARAGAPRSKASARRGRAMARETPKRDRPDRGRSGQRVSGQGALKGTKTSREASDQTAVFCEAKRDLRAAQKSVIGPAIQVRWWWRLRQATCRSVRQAVRLRQRERRGAGGHFKKWKCREDDAVA